MFTIANYFFLDSMTLTQTERGYPPVVEHVGKPVTVQREMGEVTVDVVVSHQN